MNITFICATNNKDLLRNNLLRSECITLDNIILQYNYTNVPKAYNDAMKQTKDDILCFVHQDVFLPVKFMDDLTLSIEKLKDKDWGVLGVAGKLNDQYIGYIKDRGRPWGTPSGLPKEVQTLDELLLVIKKDTFQFDENIPTAHLYGADICMQAIEAGKKVFAIDAYCCHNSIHGYKLPLEFDSAAKYIKQKWMKRLPIHTTCTSIYA